MINRSLFSSQSAHWSTPEFLYKELDKEFRFDFDPCPLGLLNDGLKISWGKVNYVNPPYGRKIGEWLKKGYEESLLGKTVVFLLPARTCTKWFHDYAMKASQIRFIKGRLKFGESKVNAPFPSMIVVFNNKKLRRKYNGEKRP